MGGVVMKSLILATVICLCSASRMPEIINLSTKLRQTDSITVNWTVNGSDPDIDRYTITVTDIDRSFTITFEGDEFVKRTANETTATVMAHEMNTAYNICVMAILTEDAAKEFQISRVEQCITASSIGALKTSSIVALSMVLLFFILCILGGFIAWKCAQRSNTMDEYEKTDMNGNGEVVPLTQIEG